MVDDYSETIKFLCELASKKHWKQEPAHILSLVKDMDSSERFYEECFEEIGLSLEKTPEGGMWFSESVQEVIGAIVLKEELEKEFIEPDEYPPLTLWYKGEQKKWN